MINKKNYKKNYKKIYIPIKYLYKIDLLYNDIYNNENK